MIIHYMKKLSLGKVFSSVLLLFLVLLWIIPTVGLFVSSLRDKDQLAITGWWTALSNTEISEFRRTGTTHLIHIQHITIHHVRKSLQRCENSIGYYFESEGNDKFYLFAL